VHHARSVTRAAAIAPLRAWQQRALESTADWRHGSFLISAAPGAGKTRPALEIARRELARGRCSSLVVACPTAPLTRQWARAAHSLGLELAPDCDSPRPPRGFNGVAVTYARIAQAPQRWARAARAEMLVVADEAHHLGRELAWGEGFASAFARPVRWLLLSGTPFRSDASPIPGVRYDADGIAQPDLSYTYAEAVRDGICRPVCFVAYDGALSWRSGEDVIESSFETVLSAREASRRYRTAISTELPDGLPRILREADAKLHRLRADGHRDAGGLVIAADSAHARRIAALMRRATGRAPVVVLHAEARAAAKIAEFRGSSEPWIVAVNMVSEGVDIPRLRVGVYASAAKTALVFRQIVGRFVRTLPGAGAEPSWLYVPADRVLCEHAASVERELLHALRPRAGADGEGELERPAQRESARAQPLDFQPLRADVAAQLTLFGPPVPIAPPGERRAAAPPLSPAPAPGGVALGDRHGANLAVTAPPEAGDGAGPAFERRASLRAQRHRLVAELRRRDGASHREINAWVNRQVGVASVQEATIDQLQRSIELLVRRLARPM
jgi:superfamily II DNA or RNA helicase